MFEDIQLFFKEFRENFTSTGAIAPSSPGLARAILKPLRQRPVHPIKVLEVGPGTGAFTFALLKHLKPGDTLHIYELNDKFYQHLKEKMAVKLQRHPGINFELHHQDIRKLKSTMRYDYIVSGLPFMNFDCKLFCGIMDNYLQHLAPEGVISFFEYILPHRLRLQFLKADEHRRVKRVIAKMRRYIRRHQVGCDQVWLNLPPASARHLQHLRSGESSTVSHK